MRYLLAFLFFSLCVLQAYSRPSAITDNESEEEEEVDYDNASDDAGENDDNLREEDDLANEQESAGGFQQEKIVRSQRYQDAGEDAEFRRNGAENQAAKTKEDTDNFPDYKINRMQDSQDINQEDALDSDKLYQSMLHRQAKYGNVDLTSNQVREQRLTNRDLQHQKVPMDKSLVKKRIMDQNIGKEDDTISESYEDSGEQPNSAYIKEYKNEPVDQHGQSHGFHHYNNIQANNGDNVEHNDLHANVNRDRRQVEEITTKKYIALPTSFNEGENGSEDEEAAIKRHVRKLSERELQELLNSLSEDKRELLKKIMSTDDIAKDSINKREITKKAGASEESNLESVEGENKLHGILPLDVSSETLSTTSPSDISKQSENPTDTPDITTAKNFVTSISANFNDKAELVSDSREHEKTSGSVSSCAPDSKSAGSKGPNKRETHLEEESDLSSFDSKSIESDSQDASNDQGYYCQQDDDLSQIMEDEANLHNIDNVYKREAVNNDPSLSDSMKSLEESFPNSNAYDDVDPYAASNLAPLVRVKRKNEELLAKKRAASLLPNAKVAFFPSKSENEDEDNVEGNEFDDESFYDRSSGLTGNNDKSLQNDMISNCDTDKYHKSKRYSETNLNSDKTLRNANVDSDPSLGSDTDNVISSVEGVDENLMFSSGLRSRRSNEERAKAQNADPDQRRPVRSTPFLDDSKNSESNLNAPKYQESDSFGPLPRNYEGELNRYKRIRRVKQQPGSEDTSPSAG